MAEQKCVKLGSAHIVNGSNENDKPAGQSSQSSVVDILTGSVVGKVVNGVN